jgi:transposase-like protein
MKNKTKKPQPIYSESFKLGVVMRVAGGELSKEQARIKYKIGGNSSILEWMRLFGYSSNSPTQPAMTQSTPSSDDPEQLKKTIQKLEKQVQAEQIRSELFKTMIEVAERELGISIQKKSDTNPSD